jgi:hypothetical protein
MDGQVKATRRGTGRRQRFCYISVANLEASGNVWLTKEDAVAAPVPRAAHS